MQHCLLLLALVPVLFTSAQQPIFLHHNLSLDSSGNILSWLPVSSPGEAYAAFATRSAYWFAHQCPLDNATGMPIYYTHGQVPFVHWPHTPSRFTSWGAEGGSALAAYNGDFSLLTAVAIPHSQFMAGSNGTAPSGSGWAWEGAAFASSDPGQLVYRGADSAKYTTERPVCTPGNPCPGDGINATEPDKAANVGLGYARLYMITGDTAQLTAALATADALLRNEVASPDTSHSPWPFRVRADTGAVVEAYTSSVTDALRLFDALAVISRVGGTSLVPRAAEYAASRERVLAWLVAYPAANFFWQGIWEDVLVNTNTSSDLSCHTALDAAAYVLDQFDAGSPIHVLDALTFARAVVDWVVDVFVFAYADSKEPAMQWGAYAVSEQHCDRNKMAFHTLHWTSVAARLANATRNATLEALAGRSFNWCTYVLQNDNQTLIGPVDQSNWLAAGLRLPKYAFETIAAVPSWAAPGEDHLMRSSGLVTAISFSSAKIEYTTYDLRSTEWLQLGACRPSGVVAGGVSLPNVRPGEGGGSTEGWWSLGVSGVDLTVFKSHASVVIITCQ